MYKKIKDADIGNGYKIELGLEARTFLEGWGQDMKLQPVVFLEIVWLEPFFDDNGNQAYNVYNGQSYALRDIQHALTDFDKRVVCESNQNPVEHSRYEKTLEEIVSLNELPGLTISEYDVVLTPEILNRIEQLCGYRLEKDEMEQEPEVKM